MSSPENQNKRLIIIGDSAFAEVAWELFTEESNYEVIAFAVEKKYLNKQSFHELPVVPLEDIESIFPPENIWFYAAIVYTEMNILRTRLYEHMKRLGYLPASFISPHAYIAKSAEVGEHCFIFEDNTVQPFTKIGNNVVAWSGNHIGHHSVIDENVFVSSHVVISGYSTIGQNSFLGVNSSVSNNVTLGKFNWVSPGVSILKDTPEDQFIKPVKPVLSENKVTELFRLRK